MPEMGGYSGPAQGPMADEDKEQLRLIYRLLAGVTGPAGWKRARAKIAEQLGEDIANEIPEKFSHKVLMKMHKLSEFFGELTVAPGQKESLGTAPKPNKRGRVATTGTEQFHRNGGGMNNNKGDDEFVNEPSPEDSFHEDQNHPYDWSEHGARSALFDPAGARPAPKGKGR
jgi:hypothetical protein